MSSEQRLSSRDAQLLVRYERVIEISQQLTSTLNTQTLLRRIVQAAAELTSSDAASILLLDSASGELRFEMASNMQSHDFERLVVRGRDRMPPVRHHRHSIDPIRVARQGTQFFAPLQIPHLERLVI